MKDNIKNENLIKSSILKDYYSLYLREVRSLTQSSVNHYLDALNNISKRLKNKNLVVADIYEIDTLEKLMNIREILYKDIEFIEINRRGRRMYSAGLNNYIRFASGKNFKKEKEKIILLDVPVLPELAVSIEQNMWKRSSIIRIQALEYAGYQCEIDVSHKSFIAEKTRQSYMEGHHAIPMKHQLAFSSSLDVYANILCLCPLCHRRIHFGLKQDRILMMNKIYDMRESRLAHSGIKVSKTSFSTLV